MYYAHSPCLNQAKNCGVEIFYIPLNKSLLPNTEDIDMFRAVEDIVMVGYPNGLWDSINNKPIFRRGTTATHIKFDYNGKKEFLIDATCFPGSSGSPVFILNEGAFTDKNGNGYIGNKVYLIGVLYAGPQHTTSGEVKTIDAPTAQKDIVISTIPNNLGIIIKYERLLEIENILKDLTTQ
jgi:hypothetical protein|nr:MAG TPA: Trypsin-like peptidase domain [Caudoviricetes sp.]